MDRVLYSKKYGVDLVRFTHTPTAVLCASKNGWDGFEIRLDFFFLNPKYLKTTRFHAESIRHLSMQDNHYLKYFKGHRDRVISLAMSPIDETFISSSLDETIRFWDLRTSSCQGLLRRRGTATVAFDPQGLIFATAIDNNSIKLYDLKTYDKGPFTTFQISHDGIVHWNSIKFSNDGKYLLLSTDFMIFLVDAFSGEKKQTYAPFGSDCGLLFESSFSPDGQYVICGCEDGSIYVWHTISGREVTVLQGHSSSVNVVQWNPKTMMIASGCASLVFWIPDIESE